MKFASHYMNYINIYIFKIICYISMLFFLDLFLRQLKSASKFISLLGSFPILIIASAQTSSSLIIDAK